MGAWIEICVWLPDAQVILSLPSWERGLKYFSPCQSHHVLNVAPLVGAWIEIRTESLTLSLIMSRSPRGSVD